MPSEDVRKGAEIIDAYTRRQAIEDGILGQFSGPGYQGDGSREEYTDFRGGCKANTPQNWLLVGRLRTSELFCGEQPFEVAGRQAKPLQAVDLDAVGKERIGRL